MSDRQVTLSHEELEILQNTSQMLRYFGSTYKMIPISKLNAFDKDQVVGQDMEFVSWINELEILGNRLLASPTTDTITIDRAEYEAMKADAERYLQIRNNDMTAEYSEYITNALNDVEQPSLDETVDQAMKNV